MLGQNSQNPQSEKVYCLERRGTELQVRNMEDSTVIRTYADAVSKSHESYSTWISSSLNYEFMDHLICFSRSHSNLDIFLKIAQTVSHYCTRFLHLFNLLFVIENDAFLQRP
jgi:hypothetical protein